mmetsp:Transcript_44640/g.137585  ORF Transcript_44640/g.137585 Transcript_44640/m.137585 type:complete len:325 (-) Transcript_44640:198-1172(-)
MQDTVPAPFGSCVEPFYIISTKPYLHTDTHVATPRPAVSRVSRTRRHGARGPAPASLPTTREYYSRGRETPPASQRYTAAAGPRQPWPRECSGAPPLQPGAQARSARRAATKLTRLRTTDAPPRSWPPGWVTYLTSAPFAVSRSRTQPEHAKGSVPSAMPCVTRTGSASPACLRACSRADHCSTTIGAPERKTTPAGGSVGGMCSAVSIAVIAPCEKPARSSLREGSAEPPPAKARTSAHSFCSFSRHWLSPTGSSRIIFAIESGEAVLMARNAATLICHHAAPSSGDGGACGSTYTSLRPARACSPPSILGRSAKSSLVAPSP